MQLVLRSALRGAEPSHALTANLLLDPLQLGELPPLSVHRGLAASLLLARLLLARRGKVLYKWEVCVGR